MSDRSNRGADRRDVAPEPASYSEGEVRSVAKRMDGAVGIAANAFGLRGSQVEEISADLAEARAADNAHEATERVIDSLALEIADRWLTVGRAELEEHYAGMGEDELLQELSIEARRLLVGMIGNGLLDEDNVRYFAALVDKLHEMQAAPKRSRGGRGRARLPRRQRGAKTPKPAEPKAPVAKPAIRRKRVYILPADLQLAVDEAQGRRSTRVPSAGAAVAPSQSEGLVETVFPPVIRPALPASEAGAWPASRELITESYDTLAADVFMARSVFSDQAIRHIAGGFGEIDPTNSDALDAWCSRTATVMAAAELGMSVDDVTEEQAVLVAYYENILERLANERILDNGANTDRFINRVTAYDNDFGQVERRSMQLHIPLGLRLGAVAVVGWVKPRWNKFQDYLAVKEAPIVQSETLFDTRTTRAIRFGGVAVALYAVVNRTFTGVEHGFEAMLSWTNLDFGLFDFMFGGNNAKPSVTSIETDQEKTSGSEPKPTSSPAPSSTPTPSTTPTPTPEPTTTPTPTPEPSNETEHPGGGRGPQDGEGEQGNYEEPDVAEEPTKEEPQEYGPIEAGRYGADPEHPGHVYGFVDLILEQHGITDPTGAQIEAVKAAIAHENSLTGSMHLEVGQMIEVNEAHAVAASFEEPPQPEVPAGNDDIDIPQDTEDAVINDYSDLTASQLDAIDVPSGGTGEGVVEGLGYSSTDWYSVAPDLYQSHPDEVYRVAYDSFGNQVDPNSPAAVRFDYRLKKPGMLSLQFVIDLLEALSRRK